MSTNNSLSLDDSNLENKFLSKEEIKELLGVSIFTVNNWIRDFKPDKNNIKKGIQNKRFYSKNYLHKTLKKLNRQDLIHNLSDTNIKQVKDKFNLNTELLEEKDKRIEFLEKQIGFYQDQQAKTLQKISELIENQQTLSSQVNQLFSQTNKILLEQNSNKKPFWNRFFRSSSEEKS